MEIIQIYTKTDERGNLSVIDTHDLNFQIKRAFYIYGVGEDKERGNHRHKKTIQGLICLKGSCNIDIRLEAGVWSTTVLSSPDKCLKIQPVEFHRMNHFSEDCILLVLSSELYDKEDYIYD